MNRLFLALTIAILGTGAAHASSVIDCNSASVGGLSGCITTKLPNFTTQLDWAALPGAGAIDGRLLNTMLTMNTVLPGLDVSIGAIGSLASGTNAEGMRLGYNFARIFVPNAGGPGVDWWVPGGNLGDPFGVAGHFNSQPNGTFAGIPSTPYGDHLIGLHLNGASATAAQLQLNFSTGFSDIGFRVSADHDSDFSVTMAIYSGLNGTGSLLSTNTFSYTGSGGTCAGLNSGGFDVHPPIPCNDAPFIAALDYNLAKSVILSSNDANGFNIGALYLDNTVFVGEVPEPATWILCSCGVALLAIGSRRRRKS